MSIRSRPSRFTSSGPRRTARPLAPFLRQDTNLISGNPSSRSFVRTFCRGHLHYGRVRRKLSLLLLATPLFCRFPGSGFLGSGLFGSSLFGNCLFGSSLFGSSLLRYLRRGLLHRRSLLGSHWLGSHWRRLLGGWLRGSLLRNRGLLHRFLGRRFGLGGFSRSRRGRHGHGNQLWVCRRNCPFFVFFVVQSVIAHVVVHVDVCSLLVIIELVIFDRESILFHSVCLLAGVIKN